MVEILECFLIFHCQLAHQMYLKTVVEKVSCWCDNNG